MGFLDGVTELFKGKTEPTRTQQLEEVNRKIVDEQNHQDALKAWGSVDPVREDANAKRESANRMAELSRVRQELQQQPVSQSPKLEPTPIKQPRLQEEPQAA